MKRLITVATLAVLLTALVLLGLNDTNTSLADTSILDNEITTSQTEVSNSSASATITITMYTVAGG